MNVEVAMGGEVAQRQLWRDEEDGGFTGNNERAHECESVGCQALRYLR